jgi:hypothetical protein
MDRLTHHDGSDPRDSRLGSIVSLSVVSGAVGLGVTSAPEGQAAAEFLDRHARSRPQADECPPCAAALAEPPQLAYGSTERAASLASH